MPAPMQVTRVSVVRPSARTGLKGPGAITLLAQRGIAVPAQANRWTLSVLADGSHLRCLRLGHGEFLIEQDHGDHGVIAVKTAACAADAHAYIAPRADCTMLAEGPRLWHELARHCAFDFEALNRDPELVVMTLLADISVTFIAEPRPDAAPALRLWCDPSFAAHLSACLSPPGDPT